jgi:hydrogenase maturation protein HypF
MLDGPAPCVRHLRLARSLPATLAVGSILKNTVCLAAGEDAAITEPHGDLHSEPAVRAFENSIAHLTAHGRAEIVAHDLYPDYFGTRFAMESGLRTVAVQHHHAHVAAVMAEHGHAGPILGLALDGFGLGDDGTAWGGELLRVDAKGYRRLGHLRHLRQPGGDMAARQPWRMGVAVLHALGMDDAIPRVFAGVQGTEICARMLGQGLNSPPTSSCGRLFDAAAAIAGVKLVSEREGDAPMALEAAVESPTVLDRGFEIDDGVLDLLPTLQAMIGRPAAEGASLFHGTLIAAMTTWVVEAAAKEGLGEVAFSGGCFFNRHLREGVQVGLERCGLAVLLPRAMSLGDPAVSLGQAWAAGLMMG